MADFVIDPSSRRVTGTDDSDTFYSLSGMGTTLIDGGDGFDVWGIVLTNDGTGSRLKYDGLTTSGSLNKVSGKNLDYVAAWLGSGNDMVTLARTAGQADLGAGNDRATLLQTGQVQLDGGAGIDSLIVDRRGIASAETMWLVGDQAGGIAGLVGGTIFTHFEKVGVYLADGYSSLDVLSGALSAGHITVHAGASGGLLALQLDGFDGVRVQVDAHNTVRFGTNVFYGFSAFAIQGTGGQDYIRGSATSQNVIYGGDGNDTLIGGAGNDELIGGGGNDRLVAKGGADKLVGGLGDDTYVLDGNSGNATIIEAAGEGTDIVKTLVSFTLPENVEQLALLGTDGLSGTGNDQDNILRGNTGNNRLEGGAGNDKLVGGAGDDTLTGGLGRDILIGGEGKDTFVFDVLETSANRDIISDFSAADDHIALASSVFAGLNATASGSLDAASFVAGSKATAAGAQIVYNDKTGALFFDADGIGAGAQVQLAILTNKPVLTADSFVVI